jgi:hypothetical protein
VAPGMTSNSTAISNMGWHLKANRNFWTFSTQNVMTNMNALWSLRESGYPLNALIDSSTMLRAATTMSMRSRKTGRMFTNRILGGESLSGLELLFAWLIRSTTLSRELSYQWQSKTSAI